MIKKYIVHTTVTGAEHMWDFVQSNRVLVRALSKVVAEPTQFRYELTMNEETAIIFVLIASPLSCVELHK